MRIRWRYHNGRYELTVHGMQGKRFVVLAQVWRSIVSRRWTATYGPLDARTFSNKDAACAWIEEELTAEVMSAHERR